MRHLKVREKIVLNLLALIMICTFLGIYVLLPSLGRIRSKKIELELLSNFVRQKGEELAGYSKVSYEYERLEEEKLAAKKVLPSRRLYQILGSFKAYAQERGIDVIEVKFGKREGKYPQRIGWQNVELSLSGNFLSLEEFLDDLADWPYSLLLKFLEVKTIPGNQKNLEIVFLAAIPVVIE